MGDGVLFDMRPEVEIVGGAVLSSDGVYRYRLGRTWDPALPPAVWIMLNPSTADANQDDPTIRRVVRFSTGLRFPDVGGIVVANLYAYRATRPADLWQADDPVGPDNDAHLRELLATGGPVVAAWGANARPGRVDQVAGMAGVRGVKLYCLGTTKDGAPRHPLYVRSDTPLYEWKVIGGYGPRLYARGKEPVGRKHRGS